MPEMRRVPVGRDGTPKSPPPDQEEPQEVEPEDCTCPRLDPEDWHEIESDWADIAFVKGSTTAVLGVPIGYAGVRQELVTKAEKAGATVPEDAMLLLGSGRFRRPILLEVEGVSRDHKNIEFPGGTAFTRLISAPWGEMRRLVDESEEIARERYGRTPDDLWVWYLTCRQCSSERNFETLIVAHYRDRM
jgi:hypothetical protein